MSGVGTAQVAADTADSKSPKTKRHVQIFDLGQRLTRMRGA